MIKLNTIYNEDCLETMRRIPDRCIDMILCDLPYGTTACKWDAVIPFEALWKSYKRIIKEDGAIVLTASQPFTSALVMSNPKMFKYEWIWEKNRGSNFAITKYQPMKEHESILIFGNKKMRYYPIKEKRSESGMSRSKYRVNPSNTGKREVYGGLTEKESRSLSSLRVPRSIQRFNTEVGFHPTQKPVPLFEYLIRTYTADGDLVLDNCMGSGTTAVACIRSKRNYIGSEISDKYCKIAEERLKQEYLF